MTLRRDAASSASRLSPRARTASSRRCSTAGIEPRVRQFIPAGCPRLRRAEPARRSSGGLDLGSLDRRARPIRRYSAQARPAAASTAFPMSLRAIRPARDRVRAISINGRCRFQSDVKPIPFAFSTYIIDVEPVEARSAAAAARWPTCPSSHQLRPSTVTWNRTISPTSSTKRASTSRAFGSTKSSGRGRREFRHSAHRGRGLTVRPHPLRRAAKRDHPRPSSRKTVRTSATRSAVAGSHALKFGVQMRWEQDNNNLVGGARPLYSFRASSIWPTTHRSSKRSTPTRHRRARPTRSVTSAPHNYPLYAQDQWKVRPNLTSDLGVRWEYFSPITETRARSATWSYAHRHAAGSRVEPLEQLFTRTATTSRRASASLTIRPAGTG